MIQIYLHFLKPPWEPGRCPGKKRVFLSGFQERPEILGHRPVGSCLSRWVFQGHPAGVRRSFLKFMCLFLP